MRRGSIFGCMVAAARLDPDGEPGVGPMVLNAVLSRSDSLSAYTDEAKLISYAVLVEQGLMT